MVICVHRVACVSTQLLPDIGIETITLDLATQEIIIMSKEVIFFKLLVKFKCLNKKGQIFGINICI